MTVLMNVLISMGPVVEVNSFTIDDQTSYGVAIRIAVQVPGHAHSPESLNNKN